MLNNDELWSKRRLMSWTEIDDLGESRWKENQVQWTRAAWVKENPLDIVEGWY